MDFSILESLVPVEHQHTIKAGTASKLLLFFAADAGNYAVGKRGLAHDTPGAAAAYIREGETAAHPVRMVAGRLGHWISGSLVEVDADLMPGVYQFGAPGQLLAEGSPRALLMLRFPGASVRIIEISLVAYDPLDSERIGVWSLASDKRHEFLRRAMPRLTEMDLALGESVETELRDKLNARKDG